MNALAEAKVQAWDAISDALDGNARGTYSAADVCDLGFHRQEQVAAVAGDEPRLCACGCQTDLDEVQPPLRRDAKWVSQSHRMRAARSGSQLVILEDRIYRALDRRHRARRPLMGRTRGQRPEKSAVGRPEPAQE